MFLRSYFLEEEDLEMHPGELIKEFLRVCGGKLISEFTYWEEEMDYIEKFSYWKELKGIEVASIKGDQIDHVIISGSIPLRNFNVFGVDRFCSQNRSAKLLVNQGFDYCGVEEEIIHFRKGDWHMRLAYKNFGATLIGIELNREDVDSRLSKVVDDVRGFSLERLFGFFDNI